MYDHTSADKYPYGPQPPIALVPVATAGSGSFPISVAGLPLLIALVALSALGNLSILPLAEAASSGRWSPVELGLLLLAGGIFGQAAIVAMLLVFGDWPFRRRLVGCWSAAIILWACWTTGGIAAALLSSRPERILQEVTVVLQFFGLSLPLAGLAVQAPLWVFRIYLGWRLVSPAAKPNALRPLSIRDYLLGTAIVAASLAMVRWAQLDTSPAGSREFWSGWAMFAAFVVSISLCSVVPAMLLMLRCRDWRIGYALLIVHGVVGGLIFIGVLAAIGNIMGVWDVVLGLTLFSSFAIFLGAGLKAIRDMGYSLVLGRAVRR